MRTELQQQRLRYIDQNAALFSGMWVHAAGTEGERYQPKHCTVQQQHDMEEVLCEGTDVLRYLTMTTNGAEYMGATHDTLAGVADFIVESLNGEVAWPPVYVIDLDERRFIEWELSVTFPNTGAAA